jgi:hypothetical protein
MLYTLTLIDVETGKRHTVYKDVPSYIISDNWQAYANDPECKIEISKYDPKTFKFEF